MSDLIQRQDAIEAVYEALRTPLPCYGNNLLQDSMTLAKAIVNNIPSAEPERIVKVKVRYCVGYCECGQAVNTYSTYCHKCGARLDWSGNEL